MAEKITARFSPLTAVSTPPSGVDIWLLDLSNIAASESAAFSLMISVDEFERAQQFKKQQHHFLATRALLRTGLAHYTGLTPQELVFSRTEFGKPFLTNISSPLFFNLSHSGNFAALAICTQGEIGIDIETARQRSYLKIVERFFHPDEIKQLHACKEPHCEHFFYRLWTLKEAFFKATGTGISTGLDKVRFYLQDNSIEVDFSETLNLQKNEWQFYQEFISATTLVALALNSSKAMQIQWFNGNLLLACA